MLLQADFFEITIAIVLGILFAFILLIPLIGAIFSIALSIWMVLLPDSFSPIAIWIILIGTIIWTIAYAISLPAAWGNIIHLVPYGIQIWIMISLLINIAILVNSIFGMGIMVLGIAINKKRKEKMENFDGFCLGLGHKSMCLHKSDL